MTRQSHYILGLQKHYRHRPYYFQSQRPLSVPLLRSALAALTREEERLLRLVSLAGGIRDHMVPLAWHFHEPRQDQVTSSQGET